MAERGAARQTPSNKRTSRGDTLLTRFKAMNHRLLFLICTLLFLGFGIVMAYSSSYPLYVSSDSDPFAKLLTQVGGIGLGLVLLAAFSVLYKTHALTFDSWSLWIVWAICVALQVVTMFFGTEYNGGKRWIDLGLFTIQPSEFMKIVLVLVSVRVVDDFKRGTFMLSRYKGSFLLSLFEAFLGLLVPLFLIVIGQSDLGTTLICAVGIIATMLYGGLSTRTSIAIVLIGTIFFVFAVVFEPYRLSRLLVFLDPTNDGMDGLGTGYQLIHSRYALANGGIFGLGIGGSLEKLLYLTQSESDFIFAIIGEETGLIGCTVVLFMFIVFLVSGLFLALQCAKREHCMTIAGITLMLCFQAFLNIGCAVGVFPTTGVPLPFFSAGGTSICLSVLAAGIVLLLSKEDSADAYTQRRKNFIITTNKKNAAERRKRIP